MGSGRYGLKQFQKSVLEGPMAVWAVMCLGVLMALRCHLERCQKYILVRVICHFGYGSQTSQSLT